MCTHIIIKYKYKLVHTDGIQKITLHTGTYVGIAYGIFASVWVK